VGRIALRAFAYHGTPIETSTSKIIQASWHYGRSHAIILRELLETQGKYMSHHDYGPDWGFSKGDARLDLTDLYAFCKPVREMCIRDRPSVPGSLLCA